MSGSTFVTDALNDGVPGIVPNRSARNPGSSRDSSDPLYDLVIIEFDDQGRPFDPQAIDTAVGHIHAVDAAADPFIIVFVHGWKHSARNDDDNLANFRRLLHANAHTEELRPASGRPRRVVGVYVGWRGLSWHWLGIVQNLTFWGRKEAALRVALGSVRELFARLRQFRVRSGTGRKTTGARLAIVGHSFGGLIVYSALAEYLIDSVAVPADDLDPVAPFGDLTILVNPAFEASRYYPLHSIIARRQFAPRQAPVFVSITSSNDWATGMVFPLGRLVSLWTGRSLGPREHAANFETMGHVPWMQTHDLTLDPAAKPNAARTLVDTDPLDDGDRSQQLSNEDAAYQAFVRDATDNEGRLLPGWSRRYSSGATLRESKPEPEPGDTGFTPDNPFWVVRASPDLVDGHNGIFRYVFSIFCGRFLTTRSARVPTIRRDSSVFWTSRMIRRSEPGAMLATEASETIATLNTHEIAIDDDAVRAVAAAPIAIARIGPVSAE